ncbi:MAG TPA: hypothetical protein VKY74_14385 [Chloroflexia bacterium]|nr:hypothetical protein [Chloroflexia bacterium]
MAFNPSPLSPLLLIAKEDAAQRQFLCDFLPTVLPCAIAETSAIGTLLALPSPL